MIILLLVLAYSMSEASTDNVHKLNTERPNVDIVRQLDYVQRMSENHNDTTPNVNADLKIVNISNKMSAERINELRRYISSKTKGACDFTCHNCYVCNLFYGKSAK